MTITLLFAGKINKNSLHSSLEEYTSRLKNYVNLKVQFLKTPSLPQGSSDLDKKKSESSVILKEFKPGDFIILLDEKGKEFSTMDLKNLVEKKMMAGNKNILFVVGAAYGFSPGLSERADMIISLSKLTFPHQVARLLIAEQLYRAFTIIRNESYHHE